MNFVNRLTSFLKKKETDNSTTPEGLCPNCWGRQEYGAQFYEAVKNNKTDINQENPNVGWVQDYADKHLSAIQLTQKDGEMVCGLCKTIYRPA